MNYKEDLRGKKFGFLTVIDFAYKDKKYNEYWLCKCNCGTKKVVRKSHLIDGDTKSCGCYASSRISRMNKINAKYGGLTKHRLYTIYNGIIGRCLKPKTNGYSRYGGKGLSICKEWLDDYMNFYNWAMANGYKDGLSIERIDNNTGYEPANCKWIEKHLQSRHMITNKVIKYKGKTHCMAEWAEILGINYNTLQSRLGKYGWSVKKAFTTPTKKINSEVIENDFKAG